MSAAIPYRQQLAGRAVLVIVMLVTVLPLLSLLSTALQPQGSVPTGLSWPAHPHWHNFADAWTSANMLALLRSSLVVVLGVVPLSVLIATMAAYGITQLRIVGGRALFALFLLGLTIPVEAAMVPLYLELRDLGLLNTRWALILPLIGLYMPFSVFWMRAHFLNLPAELSEAADIDGASKGQAFRHIHVPLAVPAISSLALLLFLWTWNQFLLAIVLIDDPTKRTMAGALGAFQGAHSNNIVLVCAGSLMIIAPAVVVFLFLQRHFVKALLQSAAK
ncbi:MAG: sugar ABC transporter permease [Pseudonocardiales bacterium]|nr:MAG: sugar ABC transporter permease [Pseudonocardiales bacterium]